MSFCRHPLARRRCRPLRASAGALTLRLAAATVLLVGCGGGEAKEIASTPSKGRPGAAPIVGGAAADPGAMAGGAMAMASGSQSMPGGMPVPMGGVGIPVAAVDPAVGVSPSALRRLTHYEYNYTLIALFPSSKLVSEEDDAGPADAFAPDPRIDGYDNATVALSIGAFLAEQYATTAAKLAAEQVGSAVVVGSCGSGTGDEICTTTVIKNLGKRLFRRPLTDVEVQDLLIVYRDERPRSDHRTALRQVFEAMFQAPQFLYKSEIGLPAGPGLRQLTHYETATALSYMLTARPPDTELLAAADAAKLGMPAEIEAQARRLLKLPQARRPIRRFATEWLGTWDIGSLVKDPAVYPFNEEARQKLDGGHNAYLDLVLWKQDGTLTTLFTTPSQLMSASNGAVSLVPADPTQRAGIITEPGLLAIHAKPRESFPIARGKFVRERLLCQDLPDPPANLVVNPPEESKTVTTRQRFAVHSQDPACVGCHRLIDPIGFAFERYDGLGRYRTMENNQPVDDAGLMTGTSDIDGAFKGAVELAKKLAASRDVHACAVKQAFRYAFGRRELPADKASLDKVLAEFVAARLDLRELFVALARSEGFVRRPIVNPAP